MTGGNLKQQSQAISGLVGAFSNPLVIFLVPKSQLLFSFFMDGSGEKLHGYLDVGFCFTVIQLSENISTMLINLGCLKDTKHL